MVPAIGQAVGHPSLLQEGFWVVKFSSPRAGNKGQGREGWVFQQRRCRASSISEEHHCLPLRLGVPDGFYPPPWSLQDVIPKGCASTSPGLTYRYRVTLLGWNRCYPMELCATLVGGMRLQTRAARRGDFPHGFCSRFLPAEGEINTFKRCFGPRWDVVSCVFISMPRAGAGLLPSAQTPQLIDPLDVFAGSLKTRKQPVVSCCAGG